MADTSTGSETNTPSGSPSAESPAPVAPTHLFGPRGRHRRPRPRKVLLAAGGLAVAAGALSLVRLTPESAVDSLATTETDPSPDPATATARSANAAATVSTTPEVSPSATSLMGSLDVTPTPVPLRVPAADTTASPTPGPDTAPVTPGAQDADIPTPTATHPTPPPTTAAPQPTPTSTEPASDPDQPDDGSICVPIIGVCVNSLTPDG